MWVVEGDELGIDVQALYPIPSASVARICGHGRSAVTPYRF